MRRRPADGAQRAWANPARSGRRRPGTLARGGAAGRGAGVVARRDAGHATRPAVAAPASGEGQAVRALERRAQAAGGAVWVEEAAARRDGIGPLGRRRACSGVAGAGGAGAGDAGGRHCSATSTCGVEVVLSTEGRTCRASSDHVFARCRKRERKRKMKTVTSGVDPELSSSHPSFGLSGFFLFLRRLLRVGLRGHGKHTRIRRDSHSDRRGEQGGVGRSAFYFLAKGGAPPKKGRR